MNITASFRDLSLRADDFRGVLEKISRIVVKLSTHDAMLRPEHWMLKGDTQEEATLYHVFDEGATPTPAAIAVLEEEFRGKDAFTYVSMWDGNLATDDGASISCHLEDKSIPDRLSISLRGASWSAYEAVSAVVAEIVAEFKPALVEVGEDAYALKQVFDDKPGVGWMLYLPSIITQQQVPEARALIPVAAAGKEQAGTIVVSVTDAPFTVDNPEHVEAANRIEIRLVDLDLLPRYVDV